MEPDTILGLGALALAGYGLYKTLGNSEDTGFINSIGGGSSLIEASQLPPGVSSSGAPIEAKTKKEQPQIIYNIDLEAPKIPEPIPLPQVKEQLKQDSTGTKKQPISTRYDISERYDGTAEVQAIESQATGQSVGYTDIKPIVDESGFVKGYHDTKKEQSVMETQPYKLEEQPERPFRYDEPAYISTAPKDSGITKKEQSISEPEEKGGFINAIGDIAGTIGSFIGSIFKL